MASRDIQLYRNQGMNATLTSAPVSCRNAQRVSFQNHYSTGVPSGNFTYQVSNNPEAGRSPSTAQWTLVTPATTHGAQPAASAAGTFAVCFTDNFLFIRQVWTHVAGGAGDLLNTWVHVDADGN